MNFRDHISALVGHAFVLRGRGQLFCFAPVVRSILVLLVWLSSGAFGSRDPAGA
jgi:hypothetical protein